MEIHFKVIGVVLMVLALVHSIFPRYFNWDKELKALSLVNQEMMKVHTFFVALVVFLMGLLCLVASTALVETELGKIISLGFGVFWSFRLLIQFFGYSKELWQGKLFETTAHILFSGLWTYLSVVFLWNYFR